MEEKDLDFLREQLSRLDEPELPPSLTSAALFARMAFHAMPAPAPARTAARQSIAMALSPLL